MTTADGHEADYPNLHESEPDNQAIVDGQAGHTFRNWVVFIGVALVVVAMIAVFLIAQNKKNAMIGQLPGVIVVEEGATLVDYVVSSGSNDDRLRLAIFAAERMKRSLTATEIKVAGKDKILKAEYGTRVPVSYNQARRLVADSDRIKISMSLYPGDLLDPKRGEFIPHDDPQAVLDYITTNTTCGSYEQKTALAALNAANAPTVVTLLCGAG